MSLERLTDALLPRALGMLSPEARASLASQVELAKAAHLVGPPDLSPDLVEKCRQLAGAAVPWHLVAAAAYVRPHQLDRVPELVQLAKRLGIAPAVVTWCDGERPAVERLLLSYQALQARELDREGLDALSRAVGHG